MILSSIWPYRCSMCEQAAVLQFFLCGSFVTGRSTDASWVFFRAAELFNSTLCRYVVHF